MADPWAFGWTQVFTLFGFLITIIIAVSGFRTFGRWRREKLEERRIETALDVLAIAHETQFIFQNIRGPLTEGYEWADMPQWDGDTEDRRSRRGPYFAAIKRINANAEFFKRVWTIQPRCMALFGRQVEHTFMKLHQARRHIEVAAQMLAQRANEEHREDNEDTAVNEARAHHYVPQSYLTNFTTGGKLFAVDLTTGKHFATNPKNVAQERDFNRIESDKVAPDCLEKQYAEFEGKVAPILKALSAGEKCSKRISNTFSI